MDVIVGLIFLGVFGVLVVLILLIFRSEIEEFSLTTPMGKLLVKLNREEKIVSTENEKILSKTSADEVWALSDLARNKENGLVKDLNPVQKYKYHEMIQKGMVKKEEGYVVLTNLGNQVLALARAIEL